MDIVRGATPTTRAEADACEPMCSSQATAHVVSAAWKCALGAYDVDAAAGLPNSLYCNFEHDHIVSPSIGGSTKALLSTIVTPAADTKDKLLPALVIAVRGSASKVDHMVNANSRPRTAFDCNVRTQPSDGPFAVVWSASANGSRGGALMLIAAL